MNGIQLRRVTAPLTPNLEDYKHKNKSKSRRKPCGIQPTNPPTPKMHKAHIHLKATHEKHLDPKDPPAFCYLHPDKPAIRHSEGLHKQKLCIRCAMLHNKEEEHEEAVQTEKKKKLDQFRVIIKTFGLRLEDGESTIKNWGYVSEESFFEQKERIEEDFDSLSEELEEKRRELLGNLMENQQKITQLESARLDQIEEMKTAISRYIVDIENNYENIIYDLSYEQFEDVMDKYCKKIDHFDKNLQHLSKQILMNVAVPLKQIQKYISKARINTYPPFSDNDDTGSTHGHNRTLQRYPTEKHNLCLDGSSRNYLSQHHESVSKMGQHRQSRDRDYYNILRGNKENLNYDNRNFH